MNTPANFLKFKKQIDEVFDTAIEYDDTELLYQFERADAEAKKQGKTFYQMVYEMLVRWHDLG